MTPATWPASRNRHPGNQGAAVPWRQLVRASARQHRTALLSLGLAFALLAITLLVTAIPIHDFAARHGANWEFGTTWTNYGHYSLLLSQAFEFVLQAVPVLAGMFLGVSLIAREAENGTFRLAWTQAASRTRWLVAQIVPGACLLTLVALGLGAEFRWWLAPFPNLGPGRFRTVWSPFVFSLSPLPLAGWVLFALALGVFLGAAIWRTVPAVAVTLAGILVLWLEVSTSWRMHYLPPLHRSVAVHFAAGGGQSWSAYWGNVRPAILSTALGWPDGRLLNAPWRRSAAWLNLHHIVLWVTYQPGSRYFPFQLIECGGLIAVSALLLAATTIVIRRRAA
jgi:hypothetical protein